MGNFAAKRSALHSVDIAAFPRIDLKVDAARPIFAFFAARLSLFG
jgi:hypothetical protein